MAAPPPTLKDGRTTADNLNNRSVTIGRIIDALDKGIEIQDEKIRGSTAAERPAVEPLATAKKAEANKMKADLQQKNPNIRQAITDYDTFYSKPRQKGQSVDVEALSTHIAQMNSLITDFDEYVKTAKTSPYIANLLAGVAGGKRSARRSVRRSKITKRKNRTNRRKM
jgi:hypothetical protein